MKNCSIFVSLFILSVTFYLSNQSVISDKKTKQGSQTCQPSIFGDGFKVCLFNSTGNVVANTFAAVENTLFSAQNVAAFILGGCYCREDCSPSQIVCTRPEILNIFGFNYNFNNQLAQLAYVAENWNVHCYCPDLVPAGSDPCVRPDTPSTCAPQP